MQKLNRPSFAQLIFVPTIFILGACNSLSPDGSSSGSVDIQETAQQVGDNMASIDEAGGSTGSIASFRHGLRGSEALMARLAPESAGDIFWRTLLMPVAQATSCSLSNLFSSCSSNVITETFSNCTIGAATLSGTVTFTWSDAGVDNTCLMTSSGHSIARAPNFTLTGRRSATLSVTKTGAVGQRITRGASANALTFTNDGIRRAFAAGGVTLFDFTTATTSGITITGAARNGRVANGGTLRVTNNLTSEVCDYSPSNVTWSSSCICATSGSWSGTCSDGSSSLLTLTGCGTADFSKGGSSEAVTFDRCY